MTSHFLNLEWKQYFRSSYWQKGIGIKILMGFFALYLIVIFLLGGVGIFPALKKFFPESDPFLIINGFLFYWVLVDLMARFFLQKLPVMTIKPLLTLPIKKSKIVNYVLGKSATSFFNFLPLFAFIPFSIVLIGKGYSLPETVTWLAGIVLVVLTVNYLNFVIENLSAKSDLSFLPLIAVTSGLFALDYFKIISFFDLVSSGMLAISKNPILLIVPVLLLGVLYMLNFKMLKDSLFLDSAVKAEVKEAKTTDYAWTQKFGDIAPFMQLDLKLIMRNKRTKSTLWMLIIGLLYGLVFYPNPEYADKEFFFIFIGVFTTGIFLINFGQFIPAWDSGYYKMLMSQNFKYERYLKSKFTLMSMSVIILFVLGIPYVYFGWKILLAHFAAAIYNVGVNTHVIMWGGTFNRKKINLDQKAAFNYQGTGAVQWLIGIPLMVLPMAIFGLLNWLVNFEMAVMVLTSLGLLGIAFHQKLMTFITNKYIANKYAMIHAFDQEN
ncbi:hypothetical protein SAMN04489761_2780 [Tenacibaculum sp. MAR_2009_124]|uniref:DUF5687 family protein n=1 Tax=Tenacibaculum sp. MAR_2009_124 TaxID=1250059 RepID=UPI000899B537|nr:DUF5687 family protein [Tenacibaculum sp. MAR_2009_124]SEC36213.1 hypothetical protein SAMN04489761_2780 [Tenacibaculum sp. MAR_2009_124]